MSKYNSLGGLFTAIADAIRAKTGGTDPIVAEDFPAAVEGISAGGDVEITNAVYLITGRGDHCNELCKLISKDCTQFSYMFYGGTNSVPCQVIEVPYFDTSKGERFISMFDSCEITGSKTIPQFDVSGGKYFSQMFRNISSLESVPKLNTVNGTEFSSMFSACTNLKTVEGLDLNKASNFYLQNMFNLCKNLTNLTLYNIRTNLQIGTGTSWGHLLTVDSLVHTIKELCTVTSSKTLTMGSANLEKIAGLYCKITDDTNEKKTMELCESTDEGAMTLADYAAEKGWSFA